MTPSARSDPHERARHNRVGIAWMVLGMSAFIGNDAMIKALGERLPAAQMLVVRGVMAITLITLVAWRMGALGSLRQVLEDLLGFPVDVSEADSLHPLIRSEILQKARAL
jgi:hypothetical protein